MANAALGLYSYAEFGLCVAAFFPIMWMSWHRHRDDPTQRIPGRWMRRLGRTTSRLTPIWNFSIEGTPPADIQSRPYVVIANHESAADLFLLSYLPWDMRWIGKEELFCMPVLGAVFRCGGDIFVRRGDRESVLKMRAECLKTLEHGMSLMMFPEGTRSKDGTLLPFKDGAFELAIEARVPILPVAIAGTHACMPKGSKWFGHAQAVARVLSPISTEGLSLADVVSLNQAARATIARALPEMRSRTTSFGAAAAVL